MVIRAEILGLRVGLPLGMSPDLTFFFGLMVEFDCMRFTWWIGRRILRD